LSRFEDFQCYCKKTGKLKNRKFKRIITKFGKFANARYQENILESKRIIYPGVILSIDPLGRNAVIQFNLTNNLSSTSSVNVTWAFFNETSNVDWELVSHSTMVGIGENLTKSYVLATSYTPGDAPLAGYIILELPNSSAPAIANATASLTYYGSTISRGTSVSYELVFSVSAPISVILFRSMKRKRKNRCM
jgi:hypothetical protein